MKMLGLSIARNWRRGQSKKAAFHPTHEFRFKVGVGYKYTGYVMKVGESYQLLRIEEKTQDLTNTMKMTPSR